MVRLTHSEADAVLRSRSQIATLKRGANVKYPPYALTENGAIMAANVLNSPQAVRMSVFVVRAFVPMRELLTGTRELARQLRDLEARLTARLDTHETAIVKVLRSVMDILNPPPFSEPKRGKIGFLRAEN
jgi:phage regulator Rha-like protein